MVMKKTFLLLLLAGTALCVFAQNGVIQELTGEVELKLSGTSVFVPARAGDTVAMDTIISTGFRSTAIITVGSSTLTVRPLTRLSLREINSSAGAENLNVNLQAGRVKVDVKPPAGTRANFTVQRPSATASVRGTSFEFDTRNVNVNEGTVAFRGASGALMLVPAGTVSYVGGDGKAVDPIETTAGNLMPPAPVGTNISGETSGGAPASTSSIDISIEYGELLVR